eukprot:m.31251 g.31251  ORF g.31251 m.31251 type:complete len:281 (+) comp10678_c1_seq1:400-1242(+)
MDIEVDQAGPAPTSSQCRGVVVFIHGWPDTNDLWRQQVDFFSSHDYHCVCLSLPNYNGYVASDSWGADFPVVRDLFISAIENVANGQPVHLIGHDWGAIYTYMIEKKAPHLVKSITTLDVGGRVKLDTWPARILVPAYQLWLIAAFLLGNLLPGIGKPVGDWMTWACAKYYARSPAFSPNHGFHINYPYFYLWKAMVAGGTGGTTFLRGYTSQCPTLYTYGAKKPFMFHSKKWLNLLESRDDCQIKPFATGHWLQVEKPEQFTSTAFDFISALDKKAERK